MKYKFNVIVLAILDNQFPEDLHVIVCRKFLLALYNI